MVTVFGAHGLRVIIFVNDHPPAHVHVFGDGQAKINLRGPMVRLNWSGLKIWPAERFAAPCGS